ncbi:MAG: cell surface protein SprA [Bacteroidia bacterium]|nr:MAG: cell surface protein SprA [Bacteroidia bacterium]
MKLLSETFIKVSARRWFLLFLLFVFAGETLWAQKDSADIQKDELKYPFDDYQNTPAARSTSPLFLPLPSNIKRTVKYDPKTGKFVFYDKIGNLNYRTPYQMSFEDYIKYNNHKSTHAYWMKKSAMESSQSEGGEISLIDKLINQNLVINNETFDRIFGSNTINIRPQGTVELLFGVKSTRIKNYALPKDLQRSINFDFDMKFKLGLNGKIGDKVTLAFNYDSDQTFDFETDMRLMYEGHEDEIIQKLEAGNVSLPLSGSLITGSRSLFGFKSELKFGNLQVTSIFSQQKGESKTIEVQGGATTTPFKFSADDYDANRHYFMAQYFRDHYNEALENLPIIKSHINIRRVEVWITNRSGNFQNSRNILAFMDLGENDAHIHSASNFHAGSLEIPANETNDLYKKMDNLPATRNTATTGTILSTGFNNLNAGIDYEVVQNARKLSPSEYTFHPTLGYISLNSQLNNDEVLAIAYEYENTEDGKIYKVGEFADEAPPAPQSLFLKLIKPTLLSTKLPTWNLMMKNVYALNAFQVNSQDFRLDVMYRNDRTGTSLNYVPVGEIDSKPLISVLGLDNLNRRNEPGSDGFFDFIEKITINSANSRIFFPVVEPFGNYLKEQITGGSNEPEINRLAEQYIFEELYTEIQSKAKQAAEKNKFFIQGEYRSSGGSEINLNAMNVPEGSVKVTSGGAILVENQDYTVDYNLGRVTIINESYLNSGTPVQISLENNSTFNITSKALFGTHLNYRISDNFNVGGTVLHLYQKPLTQKVSIGNEPISNTIWGMDMNFSRELPFLTRWVDKYVPFVKTKAPSKVDINGEFAQLVPGHPKVIGKEGYTHIDDFEGSKVRIDLKSPANWKIASTPRGQSDLFPEADSINNQAYGFNRAKIAWYNVNRDFQGSVGSDLGITADELSNHYVREIPEQEIFPNRESENNIKEYLYPLNLAFYPQEKGPYNFDVEPSSVSAGITQDGLLNAPETRWGGMIRSMITNNFEEANIEFIEFWMLDPFIYNPGHKGGDLYFNIGSISEDILRDSRQSFENGLSTEETVANVDSTAWGRVPVLPRITDAFTAQTQNANAQDVGLDGLSDSEERSYFERYNNYLSRIESLFGSGSKAYTQAEKDPANDNFLFYLHPSYDKLKATILQRYKSYNNPEGNSVPISDKIPATELRPDMEDINRDYSLSETESYYQYMVHIAPDQMKIGKNYITDIKEASVKLRNDKTEAVKWYHFKIPLDDYERKIGPIEDFKSIRFMRLFMRNWQEEVILRFAEMDLVRSDWRKYRSSLLDGTEYTGGNEITDAQLEINSVNIEENASKQPVNYVLPPGITRENSPNNPTMMQLNEQALSLKVHDLDEGDARAAYKNLSLDVRQFKKLQMFVHAEAIEGQILNDDDLSLFIRLGADYRENYYEYEVPLKITAPGYYDSETENDLVWPNENMVDIEFETLQSVKQQRNNKVRNGELQLTSKYQEILNESGKSITVVGSPNLSNIRTVMVGIRNKRKSENVLLDDGFAKSGEVWINELRLAGFNENGGWAARGRMQTNLADFSNLAFSMEYSTPGFGSIEKTVNERQKETRLRYDFSSSTECGKFFPQRYGVRIPVYFGYSESRNNPEYDPLNPDIKMTTVLRNMSQKERNEYLRKTQDFQRNKTFNISNIRIAGNSEKQRKGNKPFWHISHWTAGYGFSETFLRNIKTDHNLLKVHTGMLAYNYNLSPRNIRPFKKTKFLNHKYLRLIKDFNFYYAPSMVSFRTDMRKSYNEILLRDVVNLVKTESVPPKETYDKQFVWNRLYDLRYDLTKNLKLTYSANNEAWVGEKPGKIAYGNREEMRNYREAVMDSLMNFGRTTNFHQKISGMWNVPINKLPFLDWTSANARYDADYYWTKDPIAVDKNKDTIDLGSTIRNNQAIQLSGQVNLERLYFKINYLKDINQKFSGRSDKRKKKYRDVDFSKENIRLKKGRKKSLTHNLKTEDVRLEVLDSKGQKIPGKVEVISENKVRFTPEKDVEDARMVVKGKREMRDNPLKSISDHLLYALMSVRNVSLNYMANNSTLLPGYMRKTQLFGFDERWDAPGTEFILAWQDPNFAYNAKKAGWLSENPMLNTPVVFKNEETYTLRATLKPFNGLRIDVTANRRTSFTSRQIWSGDSLGAKSKDEFGNLSMTFLPIKTTFSNLNTKSFRTEEYENFLMYRQQIAERLAAERQNLDPSYNPELKNNPDSLTDIVNEYPFGYLPTSKDVLTQAFLAAYTGETPDKFAKAPLLKFPLPNWRVRYTGLTYYKFFKKLFKRVTLNHSYTSNYSVASYKINPEFDENLIPGSTISQLQDKNEFSSKYNIDGGISIDEKFMPLIGVDLQWKNDISTKFEYKKSRSMILSFANNQILETANKEYVVGLGYKIPNLKLRVALLGTKQVFNSDLNIRADVSYRDMLTIIRRINEADNQPTASQKVLSIKVNADYNLNKVTLRLFFERMVNTPRFSTAYPTANTYFGFSLRFNLANL